MTRRERRNDDDNDNYYYYDAAREPFARFDLRRSLGCSFGRC